MMHWRVLNHSAKFLLLSQCDISFCDRDAYILSVKPPTISKSPHHQISSRSCIKCIFLFPRWIYRYHYLTCTQQVNSIPCNLKTLKKIFYQSIAFFMHFSCSRSVVIWQCWKNISIKNLDFRSSRCGFRRRTRGRHGFSVQKTCCFGGHASLSHLARRHGVQKSGDRGQVCHVGVTKSWADGPPVKDKLI